MGKKALEKIGGNPKLADSSRDHISVPWVLSQSVQLPLALCFFFCKAHKATVPLPVTGILCAHCTAVKMQNKELILLVT